MTKKICDHTFLLDLLRRSDVIIDLGANHGEFSKTISTVCDCVVFGIEPVPELFAALPQSAKIKNIHGVIAAENGEKVLMIPEDRCATLHLPENIKAAKITVLGYSLRDFLSLHAIQDVGLLKMDIEGEEIPLLNSLTAEDFSHISQLTVEFHDFLYPETKPAVEVVKKRIKSFGFYCVPFSLTTNGDILFVRQDLITRWRFFLLLYFWRYVLGIGRKIKKIF